MRAKIPILAILAISVIGLAFPVRAQTITDGRSLEDRCAFLQISNPAAGLQCRGYIGAIADIMAAGDLVAGRRACIAAPTKRESLVNAVKEWLRRHPEERSKNAFSLVASALAEAYPCNGG